MNTPVELKIKEIFYFMSVITQTINFMELIAQATNYMPISSDHALHLSQKRNLNIKYTLFFNLVPIFGIIYVTYIIWSTL